MTPTGPIIIFFKTFFALMILIFGLSVCLVIVWFVQHACRRRSEAKKETLPMKEAKSVVPDDVGAEKEAQDAVVADAVEGEAPAVDPEELMVGPRRTRLAKSRAGFKEVSTIMVSSDVVISMVNTEVVEISCRDLDSTSQPDDDTPDCEAGTMSANEKKE